MMPHDFVNQHELLTSVFGHWPTFHDAEILSIELDRSKPSIEIEIYVWRMSKDTDEAGYFKKENEAVVRLRCARINDLTLTDFNHQNVLGELTFEATPDGVRVTLWSLYGVGGSFSCESAAVLSVLPGQPSKR